MLLLLPVENSKGDRDIAIRQDPRAQDGNANANGYSQTSIWHMHAHTDSWGHETGELGARASCKQVGGLEESRASWIQVIRVLEGGTRVT